MSSKEKNHPSVSANGPPKCRPLLKTPGPKSKLEQRFIESYLRAPTKGVFIVREFRFHPERKWRLDFAVPQLKIGIELDGFGKGHQSCVSLTKDHEKQNSAAELGWVILRFTSISLRGDSLHESMRKVVNTILTRQAQFKKGIV